MVERRNDMVEGLAPGLSVGLVLDAIAPPADRGGLKAKT